ncbi:MAG: hypothetical protein WCF16_12625 [Alphaproteobacteria bacterium]
MTISVVSICNRALDLLKADPITSLADNSEAARLCARNYEPVRDAVLRAYPWNAAERRVSLAALSDAPAWGYARQFQLPVDCLRVLTLENQEAGAQYRIEGRRVLTDEAAPLNILYLARVTDPAELDALLADTIAARLAADLAYPLTGSTSLAQAMFTTYQAKLAEARRCDAQEGTPEPLDANQWLESRA